ncbi:DUF6461 domain-containing protein [Nonomuraea sp. NPDC049028]|uniref:DUF6461 domain-containing protein n=1 Tax=Nonomuraea sp. NPDC049028 TaxID=3364348 RepID=UPI0037184B81
MIATAADYVWFYDRFPGLWEAYCLTLIRGLRPQDVVARLDARTEGFPLMSFGDLDSAAYSGPGRYGAWDGRFFGAVAVEDWCLIVEPGGTMGVTQEIIKPLSAGTRLVSHSRNVNAVSYFYWVEDGEIRLSFEPDIPGYRYGGDPDGLVGVMRQVGFDLEDGVQAPGGAVAEGIAAGTGAVFALAEYLTEIKLTAQLLEESTYLCAVGPSAG